VPALASVERIGITVEKELLEEFDRSIAADNYSSRSEAVRDLMRERLSRERLASPEADAVAGVFLIYDHHETTLSEKLLNIQHDHLLEVIASTHCHLDHHNCLEVIIMKGKVGRIEDIGNRIAALKGVKLSRVNIMAENEHPH